MNTLLRRYINGTKKKYGDWALITGASAGIGEAYAAALAEKGMNIILVARRKEILEEQAKKYREKFSIDTVVIPADLSKEGFLKEIIKGTGKKSVGLLINNAGFGNQGMLIENDPEQEANMVKVNCLAPLVLTHHFARLMVKAGKGGIIFLSSIAGNQPGPGGATYAATKVFDLYLGEALYHELRNKGIDVLSVLPGATATEFQKVADYNDIPGARRAIDVVNTTFKYLGKKASVVDGFANKMMTFAASIGSRNMAAKFAWKWIKKNRK